MTTSDIAATRHLPGSRQVQMTVTGHESGFLIHVSGQLTVATSCSFRRQLGTLVHAGPRSLLVDLENVSDIDPAGLAVLLVYARSMRCLGQNLRLTNPSDNVRRLLSLIGAGHLLEASS
jgi:anti-anti-sigma factor